MKKLNLNERLLLILKKFLSNNKAAFDTINMGMLSFISFVLISILVILLVAVVGETSIVTGNANATAAIANLQTAADLPPQFAQIIVIVIIIVGILGMLAFVGYGAYSKLKG